MGISFLIEYIYAILKVKSLKLIYKKNYSATLLTALAICFCNYSLFSIKPLGPNTYTVQIPKFSLTSSNNNSITLKWAPTRSKVLVIASENTVSEIPENGINYSGNPSFGLGSVCGSGFAVYTGNENNVTLTSLKENTTYHFSIFELGANGNYNDVTSQLLDPDKINTSSHKTEQTLLTTVCPALSGITCTLNGPNSSTYLGADPGCNAGVFAGSNPWDGGNIAGFVSWAFSAPVSNVILKSGSVNTNDFATNVVSGGAGGAITVSNLVCLSSLVGAQIGIYTGGPCCGDVSWKVTSTGSFTLLTLNNTGGQSGWIAECPSSITPVALPIELADLNGNCSRLNIVDLKWKTFAEINNAYFTIERSKNNDDWEEVGRIAGAGNSYAKLDYSFSDKQPLSGVMYYRIKQTDNSGEYKYSEMIMVDNCNSGIDNITFSPNPASHEINVITFGEATIITVYNMVGRKVISYSLTHGENKLDVSDLTNGIYFFKIQNGGSDFKMNKVVIHK